MYVVLLMWQTRNLGVLQASMFISAPKSTPKPEPTEAKPEPAAPEPELEPEEEEEEPESDLELDMTGVIGKRITIPGFFIGRFYGG